MSAICFSLDQSKILLSGNELNLYQNHKILYLSKLRAFCRWQNQGGLKIEICVGIDRKRFEESRKC